MSPRGECEEVDEESMADQRFTRAFFMGQLTFIVIKKGGNLGVLVIRRKQLAKLVEKKQLGHSSFDEISPSSPCTIYDASVRLTKGKNESC